jgi:hypothetical protein
LKRIILETPGKGQPPHRVFFIPLTINPRYRDGESRHVIASHVKTGSIYRGGASRNFETMDYESALVYATASHVMAYSFTCKTEVRIYLTTNQLWFSIAAARHATLIFLHHDFEIAVYELRQYHELRGSGITNYGGITTSRYYVDGIHLKQGDIH